MSTFAKKNQLPIIGGLIAIIALTVGICGLWPCPEGFIGQGLLKCGDIDECKVGF